MEITRDDINVLSRDLNMIFPSSDIQASSDRLANLLIESKHGNIDRVAFAKEVVALNLGQMGYKSAVNFDVKEFSKEDDRLGSFGKGTITVSEKVLRQDSKFGLEVVTDVLSHETRHAVQTKSDLQNKMFAKSNEEFYSFNNTLTAKIAGGPNRMVYYLVKAEDDAYLHGHTFAMDLVNKAIMLSNKSGDMVAKEALLKDLQTLRKITKVSLDTEEMQKNAFMAYLPTFFDRHIKTFDMMHNLAKDSHMGRTISGDPRLTYLKSLIGDVRGLSTDPYNFSMEVMPTLLSYIPERSRVDAFVNLMISSPYEHVVADTFQEIVKNRVPITQNDMTKIFLQFDPFNRYECFNDMFKHTNEIKQIDEVVLAKTLVKTQGVDFARDVADKLRGEDNFDTQKFDSVLQGLKSAPLFRLERGRAVYSPSEALEIATENFAKSSNIELHSGKYYEVRAYFSQNLANIVDHFGVRQDDEFRASIKAFVINPMKNQFEKPQEEISQAPVPFVRGISKKVEAYIAKNAKPFDRNEKVSRVSSGAREIGASLSLASISKTLTDSISKLADSIKELAKTIDDLSIDRIAKFFKLNIKNQDKVEEGIKEDIKHDVEKFENASGEVRDRTDSIDKFKSEKNDSDTPRLISQEDTEKIVAYFSSKSKSNAGETKDMQDEKDFSSSGGKVEITKDCASQNFKSDAGASAEGIESKIALEQSDADASGFDLNQ